MIMRRGEVGGGGQRRRRRRDETEKQINVGKNSIGGQKKNRANYMIVVPISGSVF